MMSKLDVLKAAKKGAIRDAYEIAEHISCVPIDRLTKRAQELVDACERVEWLQSEIDDELARLEDEE